MTQIWEILQNDQDVPVGDTSNTGITLQLKKILGDMPGGFFVYRADGDGELIYANDALIRMFGCDSLKEFRQFTGNSFKGMVHPEDFCAVEQSIWEQIAHSRYDLDHVEYRIIRKDGEIRWLDDYGHFVHSEMSGDVFYVFVGDVTEKKIRQMEERKAFLQEKMQNENRIEKYNEEMALINREYMRRIETIEGLSVDYDSIFYADLDADSLTPYRMSYRVEPPVRPECPISEFGKIHDGFVQRWVITDDREILSEAVRPETLHRRLAEVKSYYVNYRIVEEGRIKYKQLRIVDVGKEGRGSQIVMGYRNVDEETTREMGRKKVLEDALKKAEAAIEAKNAFLSNMSHDIRTPMNAIVGFTALAKKYIHNAEKASEYLEQIEVSNKQLLLILMDVLELTKLEAGGGCVAEEPCSLSALVESVRAELREDAGKKKITFNVDLSEVMHDEVISDGNKIREILMRLSDNAVKYTNPGGHVTIYVKEKENILTDYAFYQFIVADSGVGISKEFMGHIFEPFEREKNTTMGGVLGSGLGLVIAKNIVDALGGSIEVESTCGQGSHFTVSLSLHRRNARGRTGMPGDGQKTRQEFPLKQKILLVEDNEINQEIETELLESDGFAVDTAENGQIAVDMVRQSPPGTYGLILMDIQMPVMDGYQAARAIRQLDDAKLADIPIIALSANALEEDKKRAMDSGMDAHMAKPLNVELLEKLVKDILRQ
ncbi:MAG TPA: hybrid sensor histidine kinase/response regulator [Lachnospiraceae bacterium]|nr:hybrid sensor histidine kinase/response regulator [Lachnospiraceae bacterium]